MENRGNGADTIEIEFQDWIPRGLQPPDPIELSGFSSTVVTLEVPSVRGNANGDHEMTVVAEGSDGSSASTIVIFRVILPDVEVGNVTVEPGTIKDGNEVTITVEVISTGEQVPGNVTVQVIIGTVFDELYEVTLDTLHARKTITVSWTAKTGNHIIKVIVDPDDALEESKESDNEVSKPITVIRKGTGPSDTTQLNWWLFGGILVLIIVLYLAVKIYVISKRLRYAADEGEAKRARERALQEKVGTRQIDGKPPGEETTEEGPEVEEEEDIPPAEPEETDDIPPAEPEEDVGTEPGKSEIGETPTAEPEEEGGIENHEPEKPEESESTDIPPAEPEEPVTKSDILDDILKKLD